MSIPIRTEALPFVPRTAKGARIADAIAERESRPNDYQRSLRDLMRSPEGRMIETELREYARGAEVPSRAVIPKTISCERCGAVVPKNNSRRKYCPPCYRAVSTESQRIARAAKKAQEALSCE